MLVPAIVKEREGERLEREREKKRERKVERKKSIGLSDESRERREE